MKPTTLGFVFTCTLGVAVICHSAVAQDRAEAHHSFGCSDPESESTFNAELNRPSKLVITPVTDEKEIAKAENGGWHTLYDKINAAKYKIGQVDFYVKQERPEDPEHSAPYSPLTIYVKLTSANQVSLWKVVETDDYRSGESFLAASVSNDQKDAPIAIVPATGDRSVPLFDVQFGSQQSGTSAQSVEAHILLDFRGPLPAVAADLSCNSIEFFGVCGVWDGAVQDRTNYECDWIAGDNDFRCEATTWNPEITKRRTTSWFELLSGKDIPFAVPAGNPATLQEFAQLAERDPNWRNRQVELPDLGKTSHLLRIVDGPKRSSHIFGTYGGTQPFGAHFFHVILTSGEAPELGYIPTLSFPGNDPDGKIRHGEVEFARGVDEQQKLPTPTNQIDTGTDLSFAVKELSTEPQTHIYQITAREDANRAVYWLAIDDQSSDKPSSDGKTIFGMTKRPAPERNMRDVGDTTRKPRSPSSRHKRRRISAS